MVESYSVDYVPKLRLGNHNKLCWILDCSDTCYGSQCTRQPYSVVCDSEVWALIRFDFYVSSSRNYYGSGMVFFDSSENKTSKPALAAR